MTASQVAAISRLFSAAVIKELARRGSSPLLCRLLPTTGLLNKFSMTATLGEFYGMAYSILRRTNNRNEYVYKSAITNNILLGVHSLLTSTMLTELRIDNCKADVVILNGTSTAYEIKSERDSITRLSSQIDAFRRVCASVNVICGDTHRAEVIRAIPEDVGILVLSPRLRITEVRRAEACPERISPLSVFHSLRLDEAGTILKYYGFDLPPVPNTERYWAYRREFEKLTSRQAHDGFVKIVQTSRNQSQLREVMVGVPKCLRGAVLSRNLNPTEVERVCCATCATIGEALLWSQ